MTETPKAAAKTAEEQHPDKGKDAVEEARYSVEELVGSGIALLNTDPSLVAGALAQKPERKTFSLAEAEALVKGNARREIDPLDGAPEVA